MIWSASGVMLRISVLREANNYAFALDLRGAENARLGQHRV